MQFAKTNYLVICYSLLQFVMIFENGTFPAAK